MPISVLLSALPMVRTIEADRLDRPVKKKPDTHQAPLILDVVCREAWSALL
jgi:hypothetical protein